MWKTKRLPDSKLLRIENKRLVTVAGWRLRCRVGERGETFAGKTQVRQPRPGKLREPIIIMVGTLRQPEFGAKNNMKNNPENEPVIYYEDYNNLSRVSPPPQSAVIAYIKNEY